MRNLKLLKVPVDAEPRAKSVSDLKIEVYADGADKAGILEMYGKSFISGFTTNPTLMKKSGIQDYTAFAREVLKSITNYPISFEVFSDEFSEMEKQAMTINSWGPNVFVKVPITNTRKEPSYSLIERLTKKGVQLNVTAVFTLDQVRKSMEALEGTRAAIISVFAGRIADTGVDPIPLMKESLRFVSKNPKVKLLWASPRELLNIFQADEIGCHIITVTNDLLKKLDGVGKNLEEFSLETVKMFYDDAKKAGFKI